MHQESEEKYTKTIEFNGGNAFEHCNKINNYCVLTYIAGGRFMVTFEGDHIGAEKLKEAARSIKL